MGNAHGPRRECLSDLVIDEALSGELPVATRKQLEQHLAECSRCRNHWDEIERQRETFLSNAPSFSALASKVARAAKPVSPVRIRPWLAGFAAAIAAAAAIVMILVRQPAQPIASDRTDRGSRTSGRTAVTTRAKGRASLGFYVKRGSRVSEGHSGAVVHPGDLIRFTYTSDTTRYLALFNLDAERVSVYYPQGSRAERVAAGQEVALDFSIQLDQSIGREKVFALFCQTPFQLEPVRRALADTKKITPDSGCTVDSVQLTKEPAP